MFVIRLLQLLLAAWAVSAIPANTPESKTSHFVTTDDDGQFLLDDKRFRFFGTNAYWLPVLEAGDIDQTLGSISKLGIKVVRTFAFNDVDQIPNQGTWFQLIAQNGTTQINDGPNGLQKLDLILQSAKKHGIFVILSLTNNWNPRSTGAQFNSSRNFLSNDYGGMDLYVRNIANAKHHDQFYTNPKILTAFKGYVSHVVRRYADYPSLLGWELANDPRCYSTFQASNNCTTKTITAWHAEIARHIKSSDSNHLVSSGNQGFLCVGCPKLFPLKEKSSSQLKTRSPDFSKLSAFNGSHGIDNEDIINIPDIDFSTFQLFPDQNTYGPSYPGLPYYKDALKIGLDWIHTQAEIGDTYCKPVVTTAFGLVTLSNIPFFVPFNGSQAPYFDYKPVVKRAPPPDNWGVTDAQRNEDYLAWGAAGAGGGGSMRRSKQAPKSPLQGMAFYQWSQEHLKPNDVIPASGESPNDGYGIVGPGKQTFINQVIIPLVQRFSG